MKTVMIMILALMLALSSCTAAPTSRETTTKTETTTVATTTQATTTEATTTEATTTVATTAQGAAELGKPITVGDYEVTVQKVVIAKDYEGKDAITVVYDWTNNSKDTVAPIFAVSFKVFQDGKELALAILLDDKSADSMAEVRPEVSVEGLGSSFITTSKNELEIEVSELISFGEPVLLKVPFPQG